MKALALLLQSTIGTCFLLVSAICCFAQQSDAPDAKDLRNDLQAGTIIIDTGRKPPEPKPLFSARTDINTKIASSGVSHTFDIALQVIQGAPKLASLELLGDGEIKNVQGEGIRSWGVRSEADTRYLDIYLNENLQQVQAIVIGYNSLAELPVSTEPLHLGPGDAIGFDSTLTLETAPEVQATITSADGFVSLQSEEGNFRFQTSTKARMVVTLNRDSAAPADVELSEMELKGTLSADNKSIAFQLNGFAEVTEPNTELDVLSGNAAISAIPENADYRLLLDIVGESPVYKLVFPKTGKFSISLDFVAPVSKIDGNSNHVSFKVAASAIVPLTLQNFADDLTFLNSPDSIIPQLRENTWLGFLPATGRTVLDWKWIQKTSEGRLFFNTIGKVEATVGTGLLRQEHEIAYQVLQGELDSLLIDLNGPGEILDVRGDKVLSWTIDQNDGRRSLKVILSQPITKNDSITVRSQTALDAFPVRVEGLSLNPQGSIRHSGFLRLTNDGLVRIEPVSLVGLAQLSPDQFPGQPIEARQVFVYRFPAAEHSITVSADRIQPEVNVSELTLYQLTDTDRRISADMELDIREAPLREWDFSVPEDYSIVSVTGSSVADYVVATKVDQGHRILTVIFSQEVQGRQLVTLNLEKSQTAAAGQWQLERIDHPNAKSVRGDIGVLGAAGFRLTVSSMDMLLEKPISYFPKSSPFLRQAFRLREPNWSATLQIEALDRSVQADSFHLYSLSEQTVYGSALINYYVTGSPVSEWTLTVPQSLVNLTVDGQDVRTWRRQGDDLIVTLHQGVMGAYTLLVTFEQKPDAESGIFSAGQVNPKDVQGERGFVQVVSPLQVELTTETVSNEILKLDVLELPAEFRLLSSAPSLGSWQYTERPFQLDLSVNWFNPGSTVTQVVEFSEANSRVSKDGELVTDVLYYIKSRGERTLRVNLPGDPVRLWEVSVNGQPVTARQADDATLIPLPGNADPNVPVEVSLRLGKPASVDSKVEIRLPVLPVPVLKTQWTLLGDEKHVLIPSGGSITPAEPTLRPTGWEWIVRNGLVMLLLISTLSIVGIWGSSRRGVALMLALLALIAAAGFSTVTALAAFQELRSFEPIELSLPVLAAGESLTIDVDNVDLWQVYVSWPGVIAAAVGFFLVGFSYLKVSTRTALLLRTTGLLAIACGALSQRDSAPPFFALVATSIVLFMLLPTTWLSLCRLAAWLMPSERRSNQNSASEAMAPDLGAVTSLVMFALLSLCSSQSSFAGDLPKFKAANRIQQDWRITDGDKRLSATASIVVSGRPGERFMLLSSSATLTAFEGPGLRLTKQQLSDDQTVYIVSIPAPEADADGQAGEEIENGAAVSGTGDFGTFEASFEYHVDGLKPLEGIPVLTGMAAVQQITLTYDRTGLEVACDAAVRIDPMSSEDMTGATLLLGPGPATVRLKPLSRDVVGEETQFYVESSNVYIPGPGVVDGLHILGVRTSRGEVANLEVSVPAGLTVSAVNGPVGSWQFDAEKGRLTISVEPAQTDSFEVKVETQRGLDPLPVKLDVAPLRVVEAAGELGLLAIAFGSEAQPEQVTADNMSIVNLGDFDNRLLQGKQAVLHRVYRFGSEGGSVSLTAGPVAPDVRVLSKQVLSFGDERVVLSVNFIAEITRAGLFQLSFPLPEGLEVESFTGSALHHWSEVDEAGQRRIVMHLNGKTLGNHEFALTLAGNSPSEITQWSVPRFEISQANRQNGELAVRPTTGIRLRTVSRQNVSETDPRTVGGQAQGALAYRLLQKDWNLSLAIEKLEPWITGQVLHEVTLREGQTRTAVYANFNIENASIRSLKVELPIENTDAVKTLRATGEVISDLVRLSADSNVWEVRLKRRVVGKVEFGIEFEKRGSRENDREQMLPVSFPEVRQYTYYVAVRAGGRLELEFDALSEGWQRVDWNSITAGLRQAGSRTTPVFTLRATSTAEPLTVVAKRHSLADALKLRVTTANITTVLSPTGDQLTAVDTQIEVTQRSSLSVGLPEQGELFSIFVNGESVNSIRLDGNKPVWQFNILPGMDERTAALRFVYSLPGDGLNELSLISPELNVPMENIQWNVIAPAGYRLIDHDGNLELTRQIFQQDYDRTSYLSKVKTSRQSQAKQAEKLLEQANQLLQAGQQSKAKWAFNSVANQYALDAASNEDARVQLENLQTQQAVVGLNTRRQRLLLDNNPAEMAVITNDQIREAAANNPILQQEEMNYQPQQISQLLQGNTTEDNAVLQQIANRLVQHQHSTEPAPQAIVISLPEGGSIYSFVRSVQVAESAPLHLDLSFDQRHQLRIWQIVLVSVLLAGLAIVFSKIRLGGRKSAQ